jgi:hypothetical protein
MRYGDGRGTLEGRMKVIGANLDPTSFYVRGGSCTVVSAKLKGNPVPATVTHEPTYSMSRKLRTTSAKIMFYAKLNNETTQAHPVTYLCPL